VLVNPATGKLYRLAGRDPNWELKTALLLEENGDLEHAKQLYNRAIEPLNYEHDNSSAAYVAAQQIPLSPSEDASEKYVSGRMAPKNWRTKKLIDVLLPEATADTTGAELACNAHVALGIDNHGQSESDRRIDFETALAIKDTPITRYYLNKHKQEHPEAYVNDVSKPQ
jgi:hypothetical protein